jgi:hypothetical protein
MSDLTIILEQVIRKAIREELRLYLAENNSSVPSSEPDDEIFIDATMQITGYQRQTIYSRVNRDEIPVLSRNRPLTFSRTQIGRAHV